MTEDSGHKRRIKKYIYIFLLITDKNCFCADEVNFIAYLK